MRDESHFEEQKNDLLDFGRSFDFKTQNPYQNGFDEGLYFKQRRDLENYEICKFCNRGFTSQDESSGEKTMLQSTECFHLIHKSCLRHIAMR